MKLRKETIDTIKTNANQYEFLQYHRSIFEFPEEFDISPFLVNNYNLSTIHKSFFGEKYGDLIIDFRECVGPSFLHRLFDNPNFLNKKKFKIKYALLDPTGYPIRGFEYDVSNIKEIAHHLTNGIFITQVKFSVSKVKIITFE